MKKYIMNVLFIGLCSASLQAQTLTTDTAEETQVQKIKLTGGAILESNLSNFIHSGIENSRSRMRLGGNTGGFISLGLSKHFSIQGEMLFQYKQSDFSWNSRRGNFQYWGIEIPVYGMFHYILSKGDQVYIGVGPYTDFGLGAHFDEGGRKVDVYEKDKDTGLPAMVDSNTGFGVKIGYEFISGLQVNASYRASVTNIIDANSSTIKMFPQSIGLGVAYRFGK